MLHWSNVSNASKWVKCENSSLEIAQQIAAAWPFRHDIPKISKSEVLSSKMATERPESLSVAWLAMEHMESSTGWWLNQPL